MCRLIVKRAKCNVIFSCWPIHVQKVIWSAVSKLTRASWTPCSCHERGTLLIMQVCPWFLCWLLCWQLFAKYCSTSRVTRERGWDIRQLYNLVPASWLLKSLCWICLFERGKKKALWNWYVYPELISKLTHQIHIQTTMLGSDDNYSDGWYHCVHTITQKNCTLRLLCWFRRIYSSRVQRDTKIISKSFLGRRYNIRYISKTRLN